MSDIYAFFYFRFKVYNFFFKYTCHKNNSHFLTTPSVTNYLYVNYDETRGNFPDCLCSRYLYRFPHIVCIIIRRGPR